MNPVVLIFDAYFLLLVFVLFMYHRNKINKARHAIGSILCQWSLMYNIRSWRGVLVWSVLIMYLCQAVYCTLRGSTRTYGIHSLVVLFFSLGFYQRWIVAFGEKGFIRRLNMISWKDVLAWETDVKGRILLKIRFEDSLKRIPIRVPRSRVKEIENLLIRSIKVRKE